MKSQQQDQTIKTNCRNCAFAIYDPENTKTQVGCVHDRIKKFDKDVIEAYDEEREFYVINRLCTYYRDIAWGYSESDIEKVKEESAVSFDIIFNCNDLNDHQTQSICDFINYNNYYTSKLNIILAHEHHRYEQAKPRIVEISTNSKNIFTISVCAYMEEFMSRTLKNTKKAYHALITQADLLDIDILQKLNSYVNDDMKKFIVAESNGTKFIGNFTYKSLNSFEPSLRYYNNVEEILDSCKETSLYIEI